MLNKKVYIILLNYNGWKDTIECLESVLRNDYPNYQVIVVDNNSSNNSLDCIKSWADGKISVWTKPDNPLRHLSYPPIEKPIPYIFYTRKEAENGGIKELENQFNENDFKGTTTKYPLILIQSGDNLGFAGGNNVGIRYALSKDDFDAVVLLNNDTVINKNTVKEISSAWLMLGDDAIYGGRIYYYSKPNKIWYDGGKFNKWTGKATHLGIGKENVEFKPIFNVSFITFCYVLLTKKILRKIELLDENYFMYFEDLDYSYKVLQNNYKLYHISTSYLWHKICASSSLSLEFVIYHYYKNNIIFRRKIVGIKKYSAFLITLFSRSYYFIKYLLINKKISMAIYYGTKEGLIKKTYDKN